ncbi:MAG: L-threonylcarbamoyladenylate synthase [Pseudomonadota bacterium]
MALITQDIAAVAAALRQGELAAIPTETVYGLAGNALNAEAVAGIFDAKRRPSFDPLIMHLPNADAVTGYVVDFPARLRNLADALWPGPLTLLLPRQNIVPDLVTSGLERVAVRVPAHPMAASLLEQLDFPLAAPSANPFGYISPTTAEHVQAQLGERIDWILDGGAAPVGIESTIVGMEDGSPMIYRLGGVAVDQIEALIGPVTVKAHSSSRPAAPGLLEQHYAPATRFILGDRAALVSKMLEKDHRVGVLNFDTPVEGIDLGLQRVLSPTADLREAASNLFAALRELDSFALDVIVAERVPAAGLGLAINDRLQRAAARAP